MRARPDQVELMELNHKTQMFEIMVRRFYQEVLKPGDVAIDGGANHGHHLFPMTAVVGPTGYVHAFEPLPHLVKFLNGTIQEQNLPVSVHQVAIADYSGMAEFTHITNLNGLSGLFNRELRGIQTERTTIQVEVTTLDHFMKPKLDRCAFIKLDLECGEYAAMRGGMELMKAFGPPIVFENGFDKTAEEAGFTKEQWFDLFSATDYRTYDLYGYEVTPNRWPDFCQPFNTIAVPIGSDAEDFVRSRWRNEIVDELIGDVQAGELRWP